MYMMEKLDAYKQEIEKKNAWKEYLDKHGWKKDATEQESLLMLYANEMLRIHDDLKKYCNALVMRAQARDSDRDRMIFELRKLHEDYAKLDKKYKALKKKSTPAKKPAAKKTVAKKGA